MNLKSAIFAAAAFVALAAPTAGAQAVIFPQEQQPGAAVLTTTEGQWTLSNDLLSASFSMQNGHLMFNGCEALGLQPGTELFFVETQNDGTIPASRMAMGEVTTETLTANPESVRGSEHFDGHAIKATFTTGNLTIDWRAVLRDGSHYIRTELTITSAPEATAMKAIIPMNYMVEEGEPLPAVVGNTRGAILASSKIFAGLETPMGINSMGQAIYVPEEGEVITHSNGFKLKSWTKDMFCWVPMRLTPSEIIEMGFSDSDIVGAFGPATFAEADEQTITFTYKSGAHKLNIVGVDVTDADGVVKASDYHVGFTGNQAGNNVYTLNIPEAGEYTIRYFVETKSETIDSSGNISFSKEVTASENDDAVDFNDLLPISGMDHTWTIKSNRNGDNRYVTERNGGLYGDTSVSDMSKWHFVRRDNGTWDIINAVTGNYISTNTVAVNKGQRILTGKNAPATGWEFKASADANCVIIVNGTHEFNATNNSANEFSIFSWGDGTNTTDGGCQFSFMEVAEDGDFLLKEATAMTGRWSRQTTLFTDKVWKVSSVVGLIAPDQARRSVQCYSERERAMAWKPMPIYNSWYELNINRNNSATYANHFTIDDCVRVMNQWKENLYDKYDAHIQSFVWDDGWDNYGTWTYNPHFPNGFKEADEVGRAMGSSIGAWLGPVGGYGTSGTYRRNYWKDKGGMQLSNPAYYQTFLDAVTQMTTDYQFNYFKYDGISAQGTAFGPDAGATGEENAEAIIDIEQRVREIKPDIFLNTTVGTWASPFWFQYADAIWRQENDFNTIGVGNDREKWITYRDRLVHQHYVTSSPLCPINSMMTHGFILHKGDGVSSTMDYKSVLNELRCAFACGSSQVELYADYERLNNIEGGKLWADIAECIKWQEEMADVLPDAHWVGGNPWNKDTSKAEVYGWAAWNGKRSTLALRNGDVAKSYTFTLREALDIPVYITGSIELSNAFKVQDELPGLTLNSPIDIDREITVEMPAYSVFVYNGENSDVTSIELPVAEETAPAAINTGIYDLQGRRVSKATHGLYIINGVKTLVK